MCEEQVALHFNFGHLQGEGDLCYLSSGDVASCGTDGLIKIWKIENGNISSEEEIDDEQNHSILFVVSTAAGNIISVSDDCRVAEHVCNKETKKWSISRVLAKTTSIPKSISYDNKKETITLGLEEGKLITISLTDSSLVSYLPIHPSAVLNIVPHPTQNLLASYCDDGTLRIWNSETRKVLSIETILPTFSSSIHGSALGLDWSVDGKLAVTSSLKGELSLFSWDSSSSSLKKTKSFQNNEQTIVSCIKFSPDGKFLCAASNEGEILMFDVFSYDAVRECAHDTNISSMVWNPKAEEKHEIVFLDSQGQLALWDKCIEVKSKVESKETAKLTENDDSTLQQQDTIPRKRVLKRVSNILDSDDEAMDFDEDSIEIKVKPAKNYEFDAPLDVALDDDDNVDIEYYRSGPKEITMQEAFQVASAPEHKQKKCLNWTLLGMIVSTLEDDGNRMIDITLNDNSKSQPKRMKDHFGFTRAALGESGAVFSSEVDERVPATVFYRPFETWTSNSEWRIQLDYSEQVQGLAIGSGFVAVATDQFLVRIITTGGIQCGLVSLSGPYVCSSAYQDKLVIVYHRSAPFANSQCMGIIVYDFSLNVIVKQQELSLSPKSELHWLGWDEDGTVVSVDSIGVVRTLVHSSQPQLGHGRLESQTQNNGMWVPLATLPNDEDLFHWVVGCTKDQVVFVECTAGDKHPILMAFYTPALCSFPYAAPLLPQTSAGETQLFVDRVHLQTTYDAAEQVQKQQQLDKSLLRLFHSSCNDDKLQRALDFAQLLKFPKAMDIAMQVANSANISSLAEHLADLKATILLNAAAPVPENIPVQIPQRRDLKVSVKDETPTINDSSEEDSELVEKENMPAHPSPIKQGTSSNAKEFSKELKQHAQVSRTEAPKQKFQNERVINPFQKSNPAEKGKGKGKGMFFLNEIIQEEKNVVGNKRKFQSSPRGSKRTKL